MAKGNEFKKPRPKKTNRFQIGDVEPQEDYDSLKPSFSLKYMRYRGRHCISNCGEDKKALILSTLLRLSQSTWKDIKSQPKEQGFESLPQSRFSVSLPSSVTPEIPVLVIRYDKGGRLAGYRDKDVYHIVLAGKNLYSH